MAFCFDNVKLNGGFLKEKSELNLNTTIYAVYDKFKKTGRFDAFDCKWKEGSEDIPMPHFFWDSDVAKWIEGASYIIAKHPRKDLEEIIEKVIDSIEKTQWDDGYFNIYCTTVAPDKRFSDRNCHELYCAGHLMEAAVAYYYATGKDRFLRLMEKYAELINRVFVTEHSAEFATPGHEEIEIALMRMYRCTGKSLYLDMCDYFLSARGNNDKDKYIMDGMYENYNQSDRPVRELESAEGHAVRAMYLYTAMADYSKETGDEKMFKACQRLFDDTVNSKMYITGGIGSTHIGEAFTIPYDLPDETAYAETCASIGLMFFAQKMLEAEPKGIYGDIVEKAIYNGMISGLSLDGKSFFYENPLSIDTDNRKKFTCTAASERYPMTVRAEVFSCSCCPPNLNRVLASFERFIYHTDKNIWFVDQYCDSEYSDGNIKITQKTDYPLSGSISLSVVGAKEIALRIPSWCDNFTVNADYSAKDGYIYIKNPQNIELRLEMKPVLYTANASVSDCANKAALMLGPVVYCAEGIDNHVKLHRIYLSKDLNAEIKYSNEFMLNTIEADGYIRKSSESLYEPLTEEFEVQRIKLIPYGAFANRGETDMKVWLNYR